MKNTFLTRLPVQFALPTRYANLPIQLMSLAQKIRLRSSDNLLNHTPAYIGQSEITPRIAIRQFLVIDSQ